VLQSASSPNGETTAKVVTVNCGATTDFFAYVSIQTNRVNLRDDGILFGYKGRPEIQLSWSGDRSLQILCPSCTEAKIYHQVSKEEEYRVGYVVGNSSEQR
jgi:hypothetical protein